MTDTSGTITDTYFYTAFGEELAKTGTTENEFRYVGEQWDPNAGFYYLRARWYDQSTGRFASVDPFAGDPQAPVSLHRYLYCGSDGVNNIDPTGESIQTLFYGALRTTIAAVYNVAVITRMPFVSALLMKASYWVFTNSVRLEFYAATVGVTLEVVSLSADAVLNNTEEVSNAGGFLETKLNANKTDYRVIDDIRSNQATSFKTREAKDLTRLIRQIREDAEEVGNHKSNWKPEHPGKAPFLPSEGQLRGLVVGIPENRAILLNNKSFIAAIREISQQTKVVINVIPIRKWMVK